MSVIAMAFRAGGDHGPRQASAATSRAHVAFTGHDRKRRRLRVLPVRRVYRRAGALPRRCPLTTRPYSESGES
jgi:hypothetical protein